MAENQKELLSQIASLLHENNAALIDHIDISINAAKTEIMAQVENSVVRRIDSLFDGYLSTRERQELLQTQINELSGRLEALEMVLKKTIAQR